MKRLLFAFFVATMAIRLSGASVMFDSFDDNILNTALWRTVTRSSNAAVVEINGAVQLRHRGTLVTQRKFKQCDITGRLRIGGSDRFVIWTRTDATGTNPFDDLDNGIIFRIQKDNNTVAIDQWDYLNGGNLILTQRTLVLPPTDLAAIRFRVIDDGTNCAFYVSDFDVPAVSAATTFRGGDHIAFNNLQSSVLALEDVRIESSDTTIAHEFIGAWYSTKAPPLVLRTAGEIQLRFLSDGSLDVFTLRNGQVQGSGIGTWRAGDSSESKLVTQFTIFMGSAHIFTGSAVRKEGQDYFASGTFRAPDFRGKWQATRED